MSTNPSVYTIEKDTDHDYLMNTKTYEISFREAELLPSGIYYDSGTYIIPETDPWFNYFVFEKTYDREFTNKSDYFRKAIIAFADHLQTLI